MSNDPVAILFTTWQDLKGEGAKALSKASDTLTDGLSTLHDTEAFKYLEKIISGGRDSVGSLITTASSPTPPPPPPSIWERSYDWISRHKWLVGIVAVGAASGTIYYYHYCYIEPTHSSGKRRAKRAPNGARKQVVVLAGSPVEPISRVLAHDLDRRGFIVYWTTSSNEEEVIVKKQGSSDIRCLSIRRSSTDTSAIQESCDKLQQELSKPVVAFQGASPHHLELTGLIIVPDLYYPSGPVESIRPDTWSDLIYSKLLGPIFLLSNGFLELLRNNPNSRVLLLSPTIMGNLNAGFHSAECICSNALYSFALCLHRELLPQGIPLCHIQLGSFDLGNSKRSLQYQERQVFNSIRADILTWPDRLKSLYASSYRASAHLQTARTTSGTNIKNLNHAVYDALTVPNPRRVWTVGQGSVAYRVLNALIPERVMTWLIQPSVLRRDQDWEFIRDDL